MEIYKNEDGNAVIHSYELASLFGVKHGNIIKRIFNTNLSLINWENCFFYTMNSFQGLEMKYYEITLEGLYSLKLDDLDRENPGVLDSIIDEFNSSKTLKTPSNMRIMLCYNIYLSKEGLINMEDSE